MTQIAMVAGEPSGDLLGAHILAGIQQQAPQVSFTGIGGPALQKAGQKQWHDMAALSVFGYVDALKQLPRLWRIFQNTKKRCLSNPPDVFVGIDAPDFNLRLEKALKSAGIPTIQFVSPSIWAWRYERIHSIRQAVSHMLVLFPFEVSIYEKEGIPVTFVGHPLAREIPLAPDPLPARETLGLPEAAKVLAILPGSRQSEVKALTPLFLQTAQALQARDPQLQFIIPAVNSALGHTIDAYLQQFPLAHCRIIQAQQYDNEQPISWLCMQASDAVLLASGTAALEAMMFKRPMVISYILSALMRRIMAWQSGQQRPYTQWVGLPNVLANEEIAPEYLQEQATVENLLPAVERALYDQAHRTYVQERSLALHEQLRLDTAALTAKVVLSYLQR